MAEAVGIAAAAVQFIELSTKLLIAASKLRSKLENAPEKVKTSERSVRRLVSLVRTLETDLQPTSSTALADILTNESKLEAEDILEECSKEASALLDLLHGFMIKADDSFVKGKIRAFSYVKKEEEVAERCKRLDELSSRLVLWYHHQTLSLQKRQLDALFSTNNAINAIGSQMNAGFAAVTHSLQQRHGYAKLNPPASIASIDPRVALHRLPGRIGQSRAFLPGCNCRKPQSMNSTSRVGPILLVSKASGVHERSCPYYGKNQIWDSRIIIGMSLPWLFSQHVQFSFASSYTQGNYSISPALRTVNIVDRETSPGFLRLDSAYRRVWSLLEEGSRKDSWAIIYGHEPNTTLIRPLQEVLESLFVELEQDFRTGASSAMDVCSNGASMLHDHLSEQTASLLRLLIDFGIDINSERVLCGYHCSPLRDNAFTLLNVWLDDVCHTLKKKKVEQHFMKLLYRAGMDIPVWRNDTTYGHLETYLFPQLPELALDLGFPQLTSAVISRDEHSLSRLIQEGHNVNENYIKNFTPLCYAIGWPQGCKLLLQSGADPNTAMSTAIVQLDVDAVQRLLEANCALFTNKSPLNEFLRQTINISLMEGNVYEILLLIANAMANSRRRLMDLANRNIPKNILSQYGCADPSQTTPLLDGFASQVAQLLDNVGIHIPSNINPGMRRSVYHHLGLSTQAGDVLYSRGFEDIDLPDQRGCTPFMLCLSRMISELDHRISRIPMLWFLDRGISTVHCSSLPGLSLLHILSNCFGKGALTKVLSSPPFAEEELSGFDTIVRRVSGLCDIYSRDGCRCWCSNGGCLSVSLLFKRLWPIADIYLKTAAPRCNAWDTTNRTLLDWLRWCGCALESQDIVEGVCRLEIFQRLGMAHTCCDLDVIYDRELGYRTFSIHSVSESERQQLQDEDACSKVQLDALLDTYNALFTRYSDSVERIWTVWWEILEDYLPQKVWILQDIQEPPYAGYVEVENPWCNSELPDPQDLCNKTDEIKSRVIAAMVEPESPTIAS